MVAITSVNFEKCVIAPIDFLDTQGLTGFLHPSIEIPNDAPAKGNCKSFAIEKPMHESQLCFEYVHFLTD